MRILMALLGLMLSGAALAGGGPLGIDHQIQFDESGIWKRSNQKLLMGAVVVGTLGGALYEGSESRVGKTLWQSTDALLLATVSANVAKITFTRDRPSQSSDPNQWFQGGSHYSFPSGEVAAISAAVTPVVLEYANEHPAVWALELLPAYDAVARMKSQAHWQTDVLASFALGTAAGYYAHSRESPLTVGVLPHGFTVGFHKKW